MHSDIQVTYGNPQVAESDLQVTEIDPQVTQSDLQVINEDAQVTCSDPQLPHSNRPCPLGATDCGSLPTSHRPDTILCCFFLPLLTFCIFLSLILQPPSPATPSPVPGWRTGERLEPQQRKGGKDRQTQTDGPELHNLPGRALSRALIEVLFQFYPCSVAFTNTSAAKSSGNTAFNISLEFSDLHKQICTIQAASCGTCN
nr:thiamine-triphosphatase isoform X5 [Columba livia]